MAVFIAFLRAINVGGTGMLAMKELSSLCSDLGFQNVRTYIQSGNLIFESALVEKAVKAKLEEALAKRMGKRVDVAVRTPGELQAIVKDNPFSDAIPAKVLVFFLPTQVANTVLENVVAPGGEQVRLGKREIYVYYPDGMGRSKLKLPFGGQATARNINTVTTLVAMASGA
jgi:uncharacterized protein (DUF1697 family)